MHEYDAALKLLLVGSKDSMLRRIAGVAIERWLNPEIPKVHASRADLLGATSDGHLIHIELQSTNDADMALRMAEYALQIYRKFRKYPKQIVLYVGEPAASMNTNCQEPGFAFQYAVVDIRDLSTGSLLASSHIEDNLLAVLTRMPNRAATVRKILGRIAKLTESKRRDALAHLLIISGLRRLGPLIEEEAHKMPILNDILDHEVLGPAILKGRREGQKEGRYDIVRQLLKKRFPKLPKWVEPHLAKMSTEELNDLALRLLDASSLDELFG